MMGQTTRHLPIGWAIRCTLAPDTARISSPDDKKFGNLPRFGRLNGLYTSLERGVIVKTRILPVLLLTAAFPFAAVAQDTTTSPGTTAAPGASQTEPTDSTNSATGGSGTTDTGGASTPDATSPSVTPSPSTGTDASSATTTDQTASAATGSTDTFVTVPETGAWRVSDLQGKAVYGSDNESIGEINDVLVSQDGSINAVIIGVGGFLGIGEKDVAVNMSALQLGPGDTQAQANAVTGTMPDPTGATGAVTDDTATTATGTAGTTGATAMDGTATTPATGGSTDMAANNSNAATIGDDGLPDRIILNVTREQLEKAPAFEGVRAEMQQP